MSVSMRFPLLFVLFFLFLNSFFGQDFGENRDKLFEMAKRYELHRQSPVPSWARRQDVPLFRLVWISDMHITDDILKDYHRRLFQQICEEIRPVAFVITGDSWGIGADGKSRQQQFHQFLEENLSGGIPAIVLPGDNWPQGFDEVFGPSKYAFSLGGFRFICGAVDSAGTLNGCSLCSAETLCWLEKELSEAGDHPVIYIQHEPVEPSLTLNGLEVAELLDRTPQVFLALAGHVHLNLEFTRTHWRQWTAPSTGRSHCPAFKVLSFFRDDILSQDWEEGEDGKYHPVSKYLHARVPEKFRSNLFSVRSFCMEDYRSMDPKPIQSDASLDARVEELNRRLFQYMLQFAVMRGL